MANIVDSTRPEVVPLKPVEIEGKGRPEDSRLKYKKVTHPTLPLERTYCTHCGAPFGWTSMEGSEMVSANEIIVICNACEVELSKFGKIPMAVAGDQNATSFQPLCASQGSKGRCSKPEKDMVHNLTSGLIGAHMFVHPLKHGGLPSQLGESNGA